MELRQGTAVVVHIGQFVDGTDGKTPETGIDISAADEAELLKHGSTATVDISGRTWGAITGCDGWYALSLTTDDTDTQGPLEVVVQDDSECLPSYKVFDVVSQQFWDSKHSTDKLQIDMREFGGSTQSNDDLKDFADAGYDPGTNYVSGMPAVVTATTALQASTTSLIATAAAIQAGTTSLQGTASSIQSGTTALQATSTAILAGTTALQAIASAIQAGTTSLESDVTNVVAGTTALQASTTNILAGTTALQAAVAALNNLSTGDIAGMTIDTGVNFVEAMKRAIAVLQGDIVKVGNAYTYDNMAGTTYLTLTSSSGARTRST